MLDAESDKQAHAEIAKANAAMPNPMSAEEFVRRVFEMKTDGSTADLGDQVGYLMGEYESRNGGPPANDKPMSDREFRERVMAIDAIDEVIALRARVAELERETVTQIHPDAKRVRLLVESFAAGYSLAGTDMHDIHQSATHRAIVEAWIPPVQPVRIMRAEVKP